MAIIFSHYSMGGKFTDQSDGISIYIDTAVFYEKMEHGAIS